MANSKSAQCQGRAKSLMKLFNSKLFKLQTYYLNSFISNFALPWH